MFERLNVTAGVAPAVLPRAPRYFVLALMGTGTIALAIALWEYRWVVRYLWSKEFEAIAGVGEPWHTPNLWLTVLLIRIGIAAFVAVLLRVP
jgi:putative membrane protein